MMSEQTTVPSAQEVASQKPKRPQAKSQIMASEVLNGAFQKTIEAKEQGEMIGWSTSLFPQEIAETLGLQIVYPENHGAGIAARKQAAPFLEYAESHHYNNDLCSYAKIDLAYADLLECPGNNMPKPDFLLVGNNGCNEITKWFEILSRKYEIPLFIIDMAYNHMPEVSESRIKYIRAQLDKLIEDLCALTGKTWDRERFQEVMRISTINKNLWEKVNDYLALKPSPLSGFDLFNYMGPMVFCRGQECTTAVMEQLLSEIEEHAKNGTSTFPVKEEFRVFWEGIACWPYLSHNLKTLKKYGINVCATAYAKAWALDYEIGNLDDMARVYSFNSSNNILIDETIERRVAWNKKFSIDGSIYHVNRACKVMACQQQEVMRQVSALGGGLPYVSFDGDQADFRNFSEAQFETRIEAFAELMRKHKEDRAHV